MTGAPGGRDDEVEALVVDRYLESLLARRPRDVADVPADLEATAATLIRALPRYHPSFRFEEHLAARLAAAAAETPGRGPDRARSPRTVAGRRPGRPCRGSLDPVVIGSVVTSAAISLAGAAFVAWRLARPAATR